MTETQSTLSRRTFVKGSLAGLAATGAAGTALFGCAPQSGTGAGEEPMAATGEETCLLYTSSLWRMAIPA